MYAYVIFLIPYSIMQSDVWRGRGFDIAHIIFKSVPISKWIFKIIDFPPLLPQLWSLGLAWICRWTTNGSLTAYQGHGIPEFRNNATFFHSFINKHAHSLDYIDYKKVIPKVIYLSEEIDLKSAVLHTLLFLVFTVFLKKRLPLLHIVLLI